MIIIWNHYLDVELDKQRVSSSVPVAVSVWMSRLERIDLERDVICSALSEGSGQLALTVPWISVQRSLLHLSKHEEE